VGSALPTFAQRDAGKLVALSLGLFVLGRFTGTWLLTRMRGAPLMMVYGAIGCLLCLTGVFAVGPVGVVALMATSFFMSIMFPTIFVLGLRGLGPLTKSGAAMIVMAIIGGAAFTALMGLISDETHSIAIAMFVPAGCFAIVALFAASHLRDRVNP
jgi:FHS family L-fucose permease-like MFS transporter